MRNHPDAREGMATEAFLRYVPPGRIQSLLATTAREAWVLRRIQANVFVLMHLFEVQARGEELHGFLEEAPEVPQVAAVGPRTAYTPRGKKRPARPTAWGRPTQVQQPVSAIEAIVAAVVQR